MTLFSTPRRFSAGILLDPPADWDISAFVRRAPAPTRPRARTVRRVRAGRAPGLEYVDVLAFPNRLRPAVERALAEERAARPEAARAMYAELLATVGSGSAALVACLTRWIGRTYVEAGDLEIAREHLQTSLAVAEQARSRRGVAMALNLLGIVAQLTGQLDDAERLYRRVLDLAEQSREQQLAAMTLQNLGTVANIRGRNKQALRHYRRSVAAYQALGLEPKAALVWNNLGMLYAELGRWNRAGRAYKRALRSCRRSGDRANALRVTMNLAELFVAQGRLDRAGMLCERVFAAGHTLEAAQWLGEAHKHYGVVCRLQRRFEEAAWHFEQAAAIADVRRDPLLAAETARERAELLAGCGRNREALDCLNRAHAYFTQLRARRALADLAQRFRSFEERFLEIVRAWGASLDARDGYTRGHCERVADVATRLAAAAGIERDALYWFRIGALLHDVGKLAIPLEVLTKPGRLTDEERAMIQGHPAAGEALLSHIEFPWDVRSMIRGHHERWDGSGYPDGLAGERIPLAARILCIADVYDALTTTRSYRPAYDHAAALRLMEAERGSTFDPALLDLFLRLFTDQPPPTRPTECAPPARPRASRA